jgi:tetratricopeptide (TPR) repeat protein
MAWARFPYPDPGYVYTAASLKKAWRRLHAGDAEPWPHEAPVLEAWIAFHAGRFEQAASLGLEAGLAGHAAGYAPANKASCIQAVYLETSSAKKSARLQLVVERCEEQQARHPANAAAFYWHAYALGRYAQEISVVRALAQGTGGKIRASLDTTLTLAPRHADAHTALGVYHAEIIDKIGALVGGLTYGASRSDAIDHFEMALSLNPDSAIARVEYADALIMLDGRKQAAAALALREAAASIVPRDAMERLDVERARQALED